jgi:hypothetical protein
MDRLQLRRGHQHQRGVHAGAVPGRAIIAASAIILAIGRIIRVRDGSAHSMQV